MHVGGALFCNYAVVYKEFIEWAKPHFDRRNIDLKECMTEVITIHSASSGVNGLTYKYIEISHRLITTSHLITMMS